MANKIYLKNLNGFRFIAALVVLIGHVELFKWRANLPHLFKNPFIFESGSMGVDFFFVLSGFLITTLLLSEFEKEGKIGLKKFYMRRILRIWPLYYLVLLVCYLILPYISIFFIPGYSEAIHENFSGKFLFSVFFMPNVALAFFKSIPYAAPLWSVGVEEQFYLFWPVLLFAFPKRLRTILIFIACFISLKALVLVVGKLDLLSFANFEKLKSLVVATRMECMGIGGLGAYLYYTRNPVCKFLTSNSALLVSLLLLPVVVLGVKYFFEAHHIVYASCFLVIIMNAALNPKTPVNLEGKLFFSLGNISYGIYLIHCICIGLVMNLLLSSGLHQSNFWLFNVLLYSGSVLLSILVSQLSYKYFESWFLRKKQKFTVIESGVAARSDDGTSPDPEEALKVQEALVQPRK